MDKTTETATLTQKQDILKKETLGKYSPGKQLAFGYWSVNAQGKRSEVLKCRAENF